MNAEGGLLQHAVARECAAVVSSLTFVLSSPPPRLIHVQLFKKELELPQRPDKHQVHMVAMESTIEIDHGRVNLARQARRCAEVLARSGRKKQTFSPHIPQFESRMASEGALQG